MEIRFVVGKMPVTFAREWLSGAMKLITPNETLWLQNPLDPATHFSWQQEQSWERSIASHQVRVERRHTTLVPGAGPQHYKIFVDEVLAADVTGI